MALFAEFGANKRLPTPQESTIPGRQLPTSRSTGRSDLIYKPPTDLVPSLPSARPIPSRDTVIHFPDRAKHAPAQEVPIVILSDLPTKPPEEPHDTKGRAVSRRSLLRGVAGTGLAYGAARVLAACGAPEQDSFGEVPPEAVRLIINSLGTDAQNAYASGKYQTDTQVRKPQDGTPMRYFSIKYFEASFDQKDIPNDKTPFGNLPTQLLLDYPQLITIKLKKMPQLIRPKRAN